MIHFHFLSDNFGNQFNQIYSDNQRSVNTQSYPSVADIFRDFDCAVCKAPSSDVNFGAITCDSCKVNKDMID